MDLISIINNLFDIKCDSKSTSILQEINIENNNEFNYNIIRGFIDSRIEYNQETPSYLFTKDIDWNYGKLNTKNVSYIFTNPMDYKLLGFLYLKVKFI